MSDLFEKNREEPNLDHLMSLFENDVLAAFMTGHLIIESLLIQMITLKNGGDEKLLKTNFPQKVKLCVSLSLMDSKMAEYLLMINKVRNNFAHNLGYKFLFDDVFELVKKAGQVGIDFSDETIFEDKNLSSEWYGLKGVIQELFQNTAMDLSFLMEENGGEFQFA